MRKPAFCICENKGLDQLRGNCEADQRHCFRYIDSRIPLIPKSEISSLQPSSMAVQPGFCGTRSKPRKTGFLTMRLKCGSKTVRNKSHIFMTICNLNAVSNRFSCMLIHHENMSV